MKNKINCLNDVLEILNNLEKYFGKSADQIKSEEGLINNIWFRGQTNKNWELVPGVFRTLEKAEREYYFIREFKRENPTYNDKCENELDLLTYMQHYSMPTRLLDWTKNVLIAIFFAVNDANLSCKEKNEKTDGKLSILNTIALNKQASLLEVGWGAFPAGSLDVAIRKYLAVSTDISLKFGGKDIFKKNLTEFLKENNFPKEHLQDQELFKKIRKPIAFNPNLIVERMKFQDSVFTIHGGVKSGTIEDINPISFKQLDQNIIEHFIIPSSSKLKIKTQLHNIGIHEGSLFPELENQSNYLKNKIMKTNIKHL